MKKRATGKLPAMLIIAAVMLTAAALWGILRLTLPSKAIIDGSDNAARISFINRCGWETGVRHINVKSVKIPLSFDDTYEVYNDLQLRQGFDLRPYRAKHVKKYTFELTNYNADASTPILNMYAHLLVCDGEIIAADICSAEEDGLMTVLVPPSMV
ncbi:MAG: DUF4830 domain-containing protein [Ruminococcus sp.]|nr:DUF4830 domain-containing protein [Ruminococcus sp.]